MALRTHSGTIQLGWLGLRVSSHLASSLHLIKYTGRTVATPVVDQGRYLPIAFCNKSDPVKILCGTNRARRPQSLRQPTNVGFSGNGF